MQNHVIIGELMIAKHILAQVVQDQYLTKKYPRLAKRCFATILGIEKQIMSSPTPSRRNKVFHGTHKHKSARA